MPISIYIHIYIHVCTNTCIYIHMHIHIYINIMRLRPLGFVWLSRHIFVEVSSKLIFIASVFFYVRWSIKTYWSSRASRTLSHVCKQTHRVPVMMYGIPETCMISRFISYRNVYRFPMFLLTACTMSWHTWDINDISLPLPVTIDA